MTNYTTSSSLTNGSHGDQPDPSITAIVEATRLIRTYFYPITAPAGLLGNIIIFLIMVKPRNNHISTSMYMLFISINDIFVVMGTEAYRYYLFISNGVFTDIKCKVFSYIAVSFSQIGTWQIVSMTFDKYLAVRFPLKAGVYCTQNGVIIINIMIYLFIFLFNVPNYLLFVSIPGLNYCTLSNGSKWYVSFYKAATQVVGFVVPLIALIILNTMIIFVVRRSKLLLSDTESRVAQRSDVENQLIRMTLIVASVFVILTLPIYVIYQYIASITPKSTKEAVLNQLIYNIFSHLNKLNHQVNFFLFLATSSKFRRDVKHLLFCTRVNKNEMTHVTELSDNPSDKRI